MIISQSAIAVEGYYIPQTDTTIYSVEELAYLCMHKGYALDSDFACEALVTWILEQCLCEDLAYRLSAVLKERGDEKSFVETILRFVGYVPEKEIARILRDISDGLSLSGYEKKKLDADMAYQRGEYARAASDYEALLEVLPEMEVLLRAACYYNLAAAKAGMFMYEQAMDALEESYRLDQTEDTLFTWLAVARLHYPEKQYLEIVGSREDLYDISLLVEEKMQQIEATVATTEYGQELEKLREWMQYGGEDGYYLASGRVLKTLCQEYRDCY